MAGGSPRSAVRCLERACAGSDIVADMVVRAAPDGYTLLHMTATNAINATLYDNLNFNFIYIAPVAVM
jgi:hypothetical protein